VYRVAITGSIREFGHHRRGERYFGREPFSGVGSHNISPCDVSDAERLSAPARLFGYGDANGYLFSNLSCDAAL
jgi:hypothetical protein